MRCIAALTAVLCCFVIACSDERPAPSDSAAPRDTTSAVDAHTADARLADAPPAGDGLGGQCDPMDISAWRGDPPTPECANTPPSGYYYGLGGCTRFTPGLCCSGSDCAALYADRDACLAARSGCSVQCQSTVFYDERTCGFAPDIGFCIRDYQLDTAKRDVPELRCETGFPRCDQGSTPCRYSQPASLAGSCAPPSILAYNSVICSLSRYATRIEPIPLD